MVRSKNVLSVLMQVLCRVLPGDGAVGDLRLQPGLHHRQRVHRRLRQAVPERTWTRPSLAATFSKGVYIPEYVYIVFQMTFAAITPGLIVGAFAERMKFSRHAAVRGALVHLRLLPDRAHGVVLGRPDAYTDAETARLRSATAATWQSGALDFAGGTVVHINAGIAGLVGACWSASASATARQRMAPHNLPLMMIGASLLWVGWFGFNAGSDLEANGVAGLAYINTVLATAVARWCGCWWSGWCAASRPCWASPPARSPAWSPSRRHAAGGPDGRDRDRCRGRPGLPLGASPGSSASSATTTRSTCSACTASAASWVRS